MPFGDEELDTNNSGTWHEYRRLILKELQSLNDNMHTLTAKLDDIRNTSMASLNKLEQRIIVLETKAGFFGALGGLATVVITETIKYFFTKG